MSETDKVLKAFSRAARHHTKMAVREERKAIKSDEGSYTLTAEEQRRTAEHHRKIADRLLMAVALFENADKIPQPIPMNHQPDLAYI